MTAVQDKAPATPYQTSAFVRWNPCNWMDKLSIPCDKLDTRYIRNYEPTVVWFSAHESIYCEVKFQRLPTNIHAVNQVKNS